MVAGLYELWLMIVEESDSQDAIDAIVDHRRITENGMYSYSFSNCQNRVNSCR
jgi:hypothetical protein